MGLTTIAKLPGKKDINGQFKPAANLKNTLKAFKKIYKNGTYTFGDLTAECLNLGNDPDWQDGLRAYADGAGDKIKACVIKAMNNNNGDDPLPIAFNWHQSTTKKVDISQDSSGFTIDIYGYPEPPSSALGERRQKK